MAKFLTKASYTAEGTRGLLKEGGSSRKAAVEKAVGALGGKVEAFYYALGETDGYVVLDVPDAVTAVAISLAIGASGAVQVSMTPLLTAEELDAACKKTVSYRAPGQ